MKLFKKIFRNKAVQIYIQCKHCGKLSQVSKDELTKNQISKAEKLKGERACKNQNDDCPDNKRDCVKVCGGE